MNFSSHTAKIGGECNEKYPFPLWVGLGFWKAVPPGVCVQDGGGSAFSEVMPERLLELRGVKAVQAGVGSSSLDRAGLCLMAVQSDGGSFRAPEGAAL